MHGSELIFLAEDDGSGRERVRSALIHFGYRVLSASNGEVALRLCEKETPSVAIRDVVMVHVGGTATAVEPLPGSPSCSPAVTPNRPKAPGRRFRYRVTFRNPTVLRLSGGPFAKSSTSLPAEHLKREIPSLRAPRHARRCSGKIRF